MEFLKDIAAKAGNEYAGLVSDGVAAGDTTAFIDTGSYIFNALCSGSIFGGIPSNKITAIAGESSTGKTFFALSIVQSFLENNPDAGVVYYDTEAAVTREMMTSRGIDASRVIIAEPTTIQEFRHHAIKMVDAYNAQPESKRPPMLFVLDSLGLLSTTKEIEDTAEGKETKDMTKAQVIKATFRVLTLKLAKAKIPMLVTNHEIGRAHV